MPGRALLKVTERPVGEPGATALPAASRLPRASPISAAGPGLSLEGLASPVTAAKRNLAAAAGCALVTAGVCPDVPLEGRVHLPRMSEFISAETNKL